MGLCESPVARDERRSEAFSARDVHSVGYGVGAAQLVGALDERPFRPTPEWQTLEVGSSHQPFVVGDEPARDRSTNGTNYLDVEVGRGMHCLAAQRTAAPGGVARTSSTAAEASNTITQIELRQAIQPPSHRGPAAATSRGDRELRRGLVLQRFRLVGQVGNR